MMIAIHQPNHLPYIGFFDKMEQSDIFVIYDDAQFNKDDFQHRNKIRIHHGWKWLAVPVQKKHIPINEITIKNEVLIKDRKWSDVIFKEIKDNYNKSSYFSNYENDLRDIYFDKYDNLIDLNMRIIEYLMKSLKIKTKLVFSSEFGFKSKSSKKLVDIVKILDGDIYLSGTMGDNYLDVNLFEEKGIVIKYQDFVHPVYRQCYDGFIPNMSAIDALFNVGMLPKRCD